MIACFNMKRVARCLYLIVPLCGLVLSFMTGCGGKKSADEVVVRFRDPGEKLFPIKDFFQIDRNVNVRADGDYFMSDVSDAFFSDDFAFILDQRQAVSKVDLKTGQIVSQLHQIGRGPNDYLNAMNLTGDDEHLYLLDMGGKSVHVYDHDLNHQDKFNIDYMPGPSSFTKIKDGFMFLNSFENDSIGLFVVTDNRCRKTGTFLKKEPAQEGEDDEMNFFVINIGKYFIPDSYGNVVCHNPNTDELFLYDGKTIWKLCQIKKDDSLTGTPGVYIKQVFTFNGNTLVNYFCGKGACYALFDKNYNLIEEGLVVNEVPFFPICQEGNKFITAFISDDEADNVQAQIVIYKTK